MTSFGAKFFEVFKNLRSDAAPKPPRRQQEEKITVEEVTDEENDENVNSSNEQEDDTFSFKNANNKTKNKQKKNDTTPDFGTSPVNNILKTEGGTNVVNIMGCKDIQLGNSYTFGTPNQQRFQQQQQKQQASEEPQERIKMTARIKQVMKADIKPDSDFIDYAAKNMGLKWPNVFRKFGYTQGRIETAVLDAGLLGISEARYKLLLDWVRNYDGATLCILAKVMWDVGEKEAVKGLADLYAEKKDTQ